MSNQAITWAYKQDIARSALKFLLVTMANYADAKGLCYPSHQRLMRDTGQDRKTIISNLKALVDSGYLRDSNQRVGSTRSVIVYQILGIPECSRAHYVYRTYEPSTGCFYIGKRSFDGDPEHDVYRGSGSWVISRQAGGATLFREVLSIHETEAEALVAEAKEIDRNDGNPLCQNGGTPSKLRAKMQARNARYSKQSQKRDSSEVVPKTDGSSTVFPVKQSQKRDLEPIGNPLENHQVESELRSSRPQQDDFKLTAEIIPLQAPKKKPAKAAHGWPDGFVQTEEHRHFASERGFSDRSVRRMWEAFKDHHQAKGTRFVDWSAAWRTWVNHEVTYMERNPGRAIQHRPPDI